MQIKDTERRIIINFNLIAMTSITYAMKAKKLLNSKGYKCEIVRTPKNFSSGCGYSIKVYDRTENILAVLKREGISWKDSTDYRKE